MDEESSMPKGGKYDMLMSKIDSSDEPTLKVQYIKTLDQMLIIEEAQDGQGDTSYFKRKELINAAWNSEIDKLYETVKKSKKQPSRKEINLRLIKIETNRWDEIYAEIRALLHRCGYYNEVSFDAKE